MMKVSKGWEYLNYGFDHATWHPQSKCAIVLKCGFVSATIYTAVLEQKDVSEFVRYFNDRNIGKLIEILRRY